MHSHVDMNNHKIIISILCSGVLSRTQLRWRIEQAFDRLNIVVSLIRCKVATVCMNQYIIKTSNLPSFEPTYYSLLLITLSFVQPVWVLPSLSVPFNTLYTLSNAIFARSSSGPRFASGFPYARLEETNSKSAERPKLAKNILTISQLGKENQGLE